MNSEEFAARRRAQFVDVDDLLGPIVERALVAYANGEADWKEELVEAAGEVWLQLFEDESPNSDPEAFGRFDRFKESIGESLDQTTDTGNPPEQVSIDRVTKWLGTYTVNDATYSALAARGGRLKRWVTMHDPAVRETHVAADGQTKGISAPFNVGGYNLRFPGDPVGPPEIWINCRCVIQAVARTGESAMTPTTFAITDEADIAVEVADEEDLPVDELEDDEEEVTEVPVHGVLAPEGVPTGDGRQFGEGALTNRELPLPIAYQLMSAEGHLNSVTVGRIDEIFRSGNELRFRGMLVLTKEHTNSVIEGIIDGTVRGVSVDVDDIELDMSAGDFDEESGKMPLTVFSKARVAGVTIVPIPAFQEAFIALGAEFADELSDEERALLASCGCDADAKPGMVVDGQNVEENPDIELGYDAFKMVDLTELTDEELEEYNSLTPEEQDAWAESRSLIVMLASGFAPGTKDGPGWITHPIPTGRIRRYWTHGKGAAKIRWGVPGDFNRCRRQLAKYITNPQWLAGACANMHKEALGIWPGMERGGRRRALSADAGGSPAPIFNFVSAATYVLDSRYFSRVELENPRVGIVVEGDHVYGYMAQWGVCHIGITGVCTEAPHSNTDYWYYATGVVDTDQGPVHVGQITMDTGHANIRSSAKVAAAHYDNTGAAVADVAVGEDAFGIWFSGVLRSSITDAQLHALRASGRISGDWRTIGGNLEMVAGLVVNVPGLPIPHTMVASADGVQTALVAAGVVVPDAPALTAAAEKFDAEMIAAITRNAVAEYRHQEKREERVTPIREALRDKRVAALRDRMKGN